MIPLDSDTVDTLRLKLAQLQEYRSLLRATLLDNTWRLFITKLPYFSILRRSMLRDSGPRMVNDKWARMAADGASARAQAEHDRNEILKLSMEFATQLNREIWRAPKAVDPNEYAASVQGRLGQTLLPNQSFTGRLLDFAHHLDRQPIPAQLEAEWLEFKEQLLLPLLSLERELIVSIGHRTARSHPGIPTINSPLVAERRLRPTFRLDGNSWTIVFAEVQIAQPNAVGLRHIATLLRNPKRQFSGTDLCAIERLRNAPTVLSHTVDLAALKPDSGSVQQIDPEAIKKLLTRIDELRCPSNELVSAESAQESEEIEKYLKTFIVSNGKDELASIVEGRTKKDRDSARKAVKEAIERLTLAIPSLGEHLVTSIRFGSIFEYGPSTDIDWVT